MHCPSLIKLITGKSKPCIILYCQRRYLSIIKSTKVSRVLCQDLKNKLNERSKFSKNKLEQWTPFSLFSTKLNEEQNGTEFKKEENKTHFGYKSVTKELKAEKVHDVFENVAEKYDLMNDLMSGGIHRLWKDYFVAKLDPKIGTKILDVAGGTGDITFRIMQHLQNQLRDNKHNFLKDSVKLEEFEEDIYSANEQTADEESKVCVCDISENMLSVGQERAAQLGYHNIDWVCGDAQNLPYDDGTFDAYTIAYGMRNVVDIKKALREAYRVLKPGGRYFCLEFSHVKNPFIKSVYDLYSFQIIPVMGQVVAADWESYQYLVESIRKFPDQDSYKRLIEEAGFRKVSFENLTFGVTAIHSGYKI